MQCAASVPPLRALLEAGFDLRAVVLAGPGPTEAAVVPRPGTGARQGATRGAAAVLPLLAPEDVAGLARAAAAPVVNMAAKRWPEVVAAVAAHRPDVVAVACFPWRLPPALLDLPPLGCLNVHPSLLPAGRGPEPVFWALRRGERQIGVTVHRMDAGFDTGPILAQEAIDLPLGVRAPDLERDLMRRGGRLLVGAVAALRRGEAVPTPQPPDAPGAWPAPLPSAADWAIPTDLPARWAYGFARGVAPLGGPLALQVHATDQTGGRAVIPVRDALAWDDTAAPTVPLAREGSTLLVRFRPGAVRFLTEDRPGSGGGDDGQAD